MCTFTHDLVIVFVYQLQNYPKGLTPRIGISPNFYFSRLTCACIYAYASDEVLADNNNCYCIVNYCCPINFLF